MAPLPSNNTGVLFLDYSVGGESHTMQFRYSDGGTVADMKDVADQFLTALGDAIFEITITGARHRPKDETITLPESWTGSSTYGTGSATHDQSAWYIDFVGRSAGGRRVRIALFGAASFEDNIGHDYRLPATDQVADAILVLQSNSDILTAIDNETVVWYSYANVGVNAYWRNRIR
jgi:hypothetical protein